METSEHKIRVALADCHPLVGWGLSALVNREYDLRICGSAGSIATTLAVLRREGPEILVSDISLPDGSVFSFVEKLRYEFPRLKIIIFTTHSDRALVRRAMQLNVNGYVLKTSQNSVILRAIRSVYCGAPYVDPVLLDRASDRATQGKTAIGVNSFEDNLSDREESTLRLIALGYSNKEIARSLGVSPKSVETYKARATVKTGLFTRSKIVRYALANGWFDQNDEIGVTNIVPGLGLQASTGDGRQV